MSSPSEMPAKNRIVSSMGSVATLFAAYAGMSVEHICNETGVSPALLMNSDSYLPESFFEKFFQLLAATFPGRNTALEIARTAPLSYLGTPGRLLRRAPDLRTMLELFSEHCDLIADRLTMKIVELGPAETVFRAYQPLSELDGGMSAEIGLGMGARIAQECFGDDALIRTQFFHKAVGPMSAYEELFKTPVIFQAEFNAMIFDSRALDRPSRRGRPETREMLELRLKGLRKDLGLDSGDAIAAHIVRAAMHNGRKGDYTVSGLARSMGMSLSSLHRYLHALGTSAGRLLDNARKVNAWALLADSGLSVEDVTEKLGFKDERGFRKAFQRWYGRSPAKARKEMQRQEVVNVPS